MAKPNFYNDNRNRAFPFLKGTVGVSTPTSGAVTMRQLPPDFIVDCGFVTGPESGFDDALHSIYLYRVSRAGNTFSFEFRSDCAELYANPLVFTRDLADDGYAVQHLEGPDSADESASADVDGACREPVWSGYLVTGLMASLAARLNSGDEILQATGDAVVEPALIQNLSNSLMNSFELANDDRTRVSAPAGCPDVVWPFTTDEIFLGQRCIQGDIRFKPGYNCAITQNTADNTLTIGAVQNSGEGEPCAEVKLFADEVPPTGSTNNLLSGGPLCNETLRSINGIGGPIYVLKGGPGVSVVPDPESNRVTVDVNMLDLSVCFNDLVVISESL